MNRKDNLLLVAVALVSFGITSCAPKVEDKKIPVQTLARGPHLHDTDLTQTRSDIFAAQAFSKQKIQATTDLAAQLDIVGAELSIGALLKSEEWKKAGLQSYKDLSKTAKFNILDIDQSIYLDIVDHQINKSVSQSISSANSQLKKDLDTVTGLVRALKTKYLPLTLDSTLQVKLTQTDTFISRISANVSTLNIMAEFKNLLIQQLTQQSKTLLSQAKNLDDSILRAPTITETIQAINTYVTTAKMLLSGDQTQNLALGQRLGAMVDQTQDAASALKSLALVWSILDAQQRIDYVQTANPSLYKFLSSKDDSDIQSLISGDGNGLITTVELNIGVYPAITNFGVENIKSLLNQKGKEFISKKVNEAAFNSLQTLGETIVTQIATSVDAKRGDLSQFDKNLNSVLKTNLQSYFNRHNVDQMHGWILNDDGSSAKLSLQAQSLRNKIGLLAASDLLDAPTLLKTQFETIEQTLQLTRFGQKPNTSNILSSSERIDLILHPKSQQFYAHPPKEGEAHNTLNLNDQSDVLLTTSQLIRQLRDWETSAFDKNLSTIQANQVITEFKTADLNRPFFAKPDLFALALSVASETLKLLDSSNSLLMLIDNNQNLVSMDDFNKNQGAALALAAATNIEQGQRLKLIKTNDLARFQLALIEFYSATVSVEKTSSDILRQTDGTEPSLLEQIIAARKKLKVLIIAIGNFTSNQLQQKNGLLMDQIDLGLNPKNPNSQFVLADQVLAIEALVRTYEVTDIDVYLWSALDIYYAMNSKMYNADLKFYNASLQSQSSAKNTSLDAPTILKSYKSLLRLMPYLSVDSQAQLENIFSGWLKSI